MLGAIGGRRYRGTAVGSSVVAARLVLGELSPFLNDPRAVSINSGENFLGLLMPLDDRDVVLSSEDGGSGCSSTVCFLLRLMVVSTASGANLLLGACDEDSTVAVACLLWLLFDVVCIGSGANLFRVGGASGSWVASVGFLREVLVDVSTGSGANLLRVD